MELPDDQESKSFVVLPLSSCGLLGIYSQLSLRRTPLGPALGVRLREVSVL